MHRPIDAVATRGGKVLVLEAKVGLTKKLRQQIWFGAYGADYAIAAVKSRPRAEGIEWCQKAKIGLWLVRDGVVEELIAPVQHDDVHGTYRERLTQAVEMMHEQQTPGGMPCLAGEGAAQDVQRRVHEYRASHPKATWREIHANVPSHYRTAPNMYSALRSNQERLAFRVRMKARRLANSSHEP